MYTATALLLAAIPAVLAAPLTPRQTTSSTSYAFSIMTLRSGSALQYGQIAATNGTFWVGLPTSTSCPTDACSSFPNTTIFVYEAGNPAYPLFLDAVVPGGQNVFVAEGGALSFTEPHAEYVFPADAYVSGFAYDGGDLSFNGGGATGFVACPGAGAPDGPYQIFANVAGFNDGTAPGGSAADCLGFDTILTNATAAGAYQYE